MRQTVAVTEILDPLIRIQEEIKEVERREQEHRQLITSVSSISVNDCGDTNDTNNSDDNHNDSLQSLSPVPPITANSLTASEDCNSNMPSLALSVNSAKDYDHHSDDSGISASSSPVNGVSANIKKLNEACKLQTAKAVPAKENRYKGPNCYNMTPEPPQQKLMTRTVSTPMLSAITKAPPRQFAINPAHKGVMQRFIASRGKIHLNNNNAGLGGNKIFLNGKNAVTIMGLNSPNTPPNTPMTPTNGHGHNQCDFGLRSGGATILPSNTLMPPIISERDAEGRPLRKGYVPVEVKIQRELQDLKSRENELKKIRKIRQSTPDLLDAMNNEMVDTDDDDSEVEHCYGPGKLRAAKSIGDMCDNQSNQSQSVSPMPDVSGNGGGMRPAVSLAMLCDLDPEEAPSSRGLIAQWENLIQKNA